MKSDYMRSHVTLVTDVTGKKYYSPHVRARAREWVKYLFSLYIPPHVRARARVEGNGNNLSHLSHLSQTD